MADAGVGGLAYSGKIMAPSAFTPGVAAIRDAIGARTGERFDCALINWYENGSCACAWHSDPEHGDTGPRSKWERASAVVCAGTTRRFLFRPADTESREEAQMHAFSVAHGDVVWMHGRCQDDWEHAVGHSPNADDGPRVSLVFKRSIVQPNG